MANYNPGGWQEGRKMQEHKKGRAIGGQGVIRVKLCIDCRFRDAKTPCALRRSLDAVSAREACKGKDFVLR